MKLGSFKEKKIGREESEAGHVALCKAEEGLWMFRFGLMQCHWQILSGTVTWPVLHV